MPAKKRPRKDFVPCVAGSWSPTRASRGGVEMRAQRPACSARPCAIWTTAFGWSFFGPPIGSQQYVNKSTPSGVVRVKVGVWLIVGTPS
jgi:hypothetical protein